MTSEPFDTLAEMKLKHLPNNTRLLIQRQKGTMIPDDAIQFGLPTVFIGEHGQPVFCKGPSIQLEQLSELIKLLTDIYKRYVDTTKSDDTRSYTFADLA